MAGTGGKVLPKPKSLDNVLVKPVNSGVRVYIKNRPVSSDNYPSRICPGSFPEESPTAEQITSDEEQYPLLRPASMIAGRTTNKDAPKYTITNGNLHGSKDDSPHEINFTQDVRDNLPTDKQFQENWSKDLFGRDPHSEISLYVRCTPCNNAVSYSTESLAAGSGDPPRISPAHSTASLTLHPNRSMLSRSRSMVNQSSLIDNEDEILRKSRFGNHREASLTFRCNSTPVGVLGEDRLTQGDKQGASETAARRAHYSDSSTTRLRLSALSSGKGREFMSRKPKLDGELVADVEPVKSSFFAKGRDFESVYTNHSYTAHEREILAGHESFDYLPSHSAAYKDWLKRQPSRLDWDRWVMMGMIGVSIGVVGFLLHQVIHSIADLKWHRAEDLMLQDNLLKTWIWVTGYSVCLAAISSASVAFVCLPAGGSGIPEVIGFLNGTVMRHVLNLPALCVKFFSCSIAVGAGLPVGPEGPMIHIGSIVGTGLSQFRSKTLRINTHFFERFRNSEDRRNFTTAGAAAGVAAAFGAPVGGLLFAMEEVSSFWSMRLGWMIFFCCMLATFTADIFNSSIESFHVNWSEFGLFQTDKFIIFKLGNAILVNVIMFIPAVLLGLIGGTLGALFTITNLKISRFRRHVMSQIKNPLTKKFVRFLEPPVIMIIWAAITVFLPSAFPCRPLLCPRPTVNISQHEASYASEIPNNISQPISYSQNIPLHFEAHVEYSMVTESGGDTNQHRTPGRSITGHRLVECPADSSGYAVDDNLQQYWCMEPVRDNGTLIDGEFNEVASLLNVHGQKALRLLYSRRTHYQFSYASLLTILPVYFIAACWAAGSAVASGLVVPMLFIGALYGRMIGRLLVDLHGGVPKDIFWQWIDPGALALIGSASFFGGVSRLTVSLAVIMIEITNDVAFLLPIMVAIMVSKWVGDYITHPLYHSQLELKCIPFLESEPLVYDDHAKLQNLELFKARDVMHSPVITITPRETMAHLAHLLLETAHGGFPVVKYFPETGYEVAYGLLTRNELCVILCHQRTREVAVTAGITISDMIPYEELSAEMTACQTNLVEILESYVCQPLYSDIFINLEPYVNRSSPRIEEDFSLHRTYIVFRTLGLRHLTVVDIANRAVGIITRKDLMGFALEEKLERRKRRGYSLTGGAMRLLPSEQQDGAVTDLSTILVDKQRDRQQRYATASKSHDSSQRSASLDGVFTGNGRVDAV